MSVTISRTNFSGAVLLAIGALPDGITAAIATSPTTTNGASVTLTASAMATPGNYPITITGSGVGIAAATTSAVLTLTASAASITIGVTPATISAVQGGTAQSSVSITRSNFAGPVSLSTSGVPSGVSVSITTSPTIANSAIVAFQVGTGVAAGSYPIAITAAGAGLSSAGASLTLNIAPPAGAGNTTLSFCAPSAIMPVWLAVQDANGRWQQVPPGANSSFSFNRPPRAGVAYVVAQGASSLLSVRYDQISELRAACTTTLPGKTVTGSVLGLSDPAEVVSVALGGATATRAPTLVNPGFTITGVANGPVDLLASRATIPPLGVGPVVNRIVLRRGLNPLDGTSLGPVDFNSTIDAFSPVARTLAVTGSSGASAVTLVTSFASAAGGSSILKITNAPADVATLAVPPTRTQPGDLHTYTASAVLTSGTDQSQWSIASQFRDPPATIPMGLGVPSNAPLLSTLSSAPYARIRFQLTRQSDYASFWTMSLQQTARSVSIAVDAQFVGSATMLDVAIPDFTGVAGWQSAWGPVAGMPSTWLQFSWGFVSGGGQNGDGSIVRSAFRQGAVTP